MKLTKRIILVLYILIMITPSAIITMTASLLWLFGIDIDNAGDAVFDLITDNKLTQYLTKK